MESPDGLMAERLLDAGWEVVKSAGISINLPAHFTARHPRLPSSYAHFLGELRRCVHPLGDSWFLGLEDFEGASSSAFSWNDFEKQSLEAAEGDELWEQEIRDFWDEVIPIALSVRNGYAYLGLRVGDDRFGSVVLGREPEFEEVTDLAASFQDLCRIVVKHLDGRKHAALSGFL